MDINKVMESLQSHEALQKQLEDKIDKDSRQDAMLKNTLIRNRDSKVERMNNLEAELKDLDNLEKKLLEKTYHRNINLIEQVDKRSSYTKFK